MVVPIALPIALGVAGWFTAGLPGAVAAASVGVLVDIAVVVGAAVWARQLGEHLHPEDAFDVAPRPPGFRTLCEWVYRRTLFPA